MHKYLEFKDEASNKFWQIDLDGVSFTVRFGKVGTAGQTQTKTFTDEAAAEKEAMKLLNSKLKKGYAEAGEPVANSKAAAPEKEPAKNAEPTAAEEDPKVTVNKAYWELQDGSFFIYMQWGRWTTSLRYKSGKAGKAQPRGVGLLSEESAIEDFKEDTEEMLPQKKRDIDFKETTLVELKASVDELAADLSAQKEDFLKQAAEFYESLPPVLPEPLLESVMTLINRVKDDYAQREVGMPLDEVKEMLGPLFAAFFESEGISIKNKMACLKEAEVMYSALPPVLSDELLESTAACVDKLLEKYMGKGKGKVICVDDEALAPADSAIAEEAGGATQYYELDNKFLAITPDGNSFTVQFGKIGTMGQTQEKYFDDEETAAKEAEKLIKSKTRKGYALAALPAYIAQAASKSQATAVAQEAPKPKTRTLPEPGPDVKGGERKLADPDDYDDEDDIRFDLDTLRTPEVVDVKPKAASAPKPKADAPACAGYDEEAFNAAADEIMKVLDRCRGASAAELVENVKRARPTDEQLKDVYKRAARLIFSDDPWYVSLQALDMLPVIVDAGVDIAAIAADYTKRAEKYHGRAAAKYHDIKPLFKLIAQNIKDKSVDDIVTDFYRGVADIAVKQLEQVVAAIKAGAQEKILGDKLPEGETGFMINADDQIAIYTAVGRESLIKQDYKPADDVKGSVIKRYLTPVIKPMLEKMMNEGAFDDIAAGGYIRIGLYRDPEPIVERRIDEAYLAEKAAELEAALTELEKGDFTGDAALLDLTVCLYCEPNGIIVEKDTDRILALLKRCLYSGEEAFEEMARGLINKYDKLDYGTWRHVYISFFWNNFDYKWAGDAMSRMADEGYQNAKDTLRAWGVAAVSSDDGEDDETSGGIDYKEVYGYGDDARAAEHRDKFTEAELFTETDAVIARAFSDGYIRIRFKEESEQGYSDALDWLNALMRAGYSKVHDGYELWVYFLAEPVFFEEMRDMMDEYQWPANDSHAFFCKAVRYPALRDKVADFARLTLKIHDHYLNLDGEFSTVAGTFAATAVAMADVKYMDVAIQYAVETDGEHEEMASLFADVLEERWGVTPETAVAIALLKMSYDHDDLGLSDDFWKYPQNLETLTEYFSGTPMHYKEQKIVRLGNNLFEEAENGLKKLKKLFKDATDPKAKAAYADFHNMLLGALEKEEGDEYGKAIDYKAPVPKTDKKTSASSFKELPENPPCIITMAEAKKRGFTDENFDPMEHRGDTPWWATIFAPLVITNPYIYDFFEANRAARQNLDHMCSTIFDADMVCTFKNKIALDLRGAPYQFGMMVYDKKEGAMLYGLYDYCKVIAKIGGKKIDRAKMEALRDEFMFTDDPDLTPKDYMGVPLDAPGNPAIKLMEEARDAIFDERYLRAVKKLEQITPEAGEVYDASLIVLASLMRIKDDKAALKGVYETAVSRMPRYKAYWDEKLKGL